MLPILIRRIIMTTLLWMVLCVSNLHMWLYCLVTLTDYKIHISFYTDVFYKVYEIVYGWKILWETNKIVNTFPMCFKF